MLAVLLCALLGVGIADAKKDVGTIFDPDMPTVEGENENFKKKEEPPVETSLSYRREDDNT